MTPSGYRRIWSSFCHRNLFRKLPVANCGAARLGGFSSKEIWASVSNQLGCRLPDSLYVARDRASGVGQKVEQGLHLNFSMACTPCRCLLFSCFRCGLSSQSLKTRSAQLGSHTKALG